MNIWSNQRVRDTENKKIGEPVKSNEFDSQKNNLTERIIWFSRPKRKEYTQKSQERKDPSIII